jgi:hypothetical protein
LVTPITALAGGTAAGFGLLIALYPTMTKGLDGFRLLLALALGTAAIFLLIESVNRIVKHDRWRATSAVGAGLLAISMLVALLSVPDGEASLPVDDALRLSMKPVEPEFFSLAFEDEIRKPAADEGWLELRRRGGIEVGDSRFHLVLANEGARPISVLSVHPEVVDSMPMPGGTLAWHPAQGDEAVGKMTALIASGQPGSAGQVFEGFVNPDLLDLATPYFQSKYILLKPGEVYPIELTVLATAGRTIRYRIVAEGESANRRFVAESSAHTIVGGEEDIYQRHYARYYRMGFFSNECTPTPGNPWVDGSYTARSEACPEGLGSPYPVQPPSATEYPPGELELKLGLTPGHQSVYVSGVRVGDEPAAAPVGDVVRKLLRALGSWDSCIVRSPTPSYWTARWDRLELDLAFAASGEGDCTPASRSSLRRIRAASSDASIETEFGPIVLGAPSTSLPRGAQEILGGVEGYDGERQLYVRGTAACPTASQRELAGAGEPAGVVVLDEELTTTLLTGLETYLPASDC